MRLPLFQRINSAHLLGLSVIVNMEAGSRFERARSAAWARSARERGNLESIKEETAEVNRGLLNRCVLDQQTEFTGRGEPKWAGATARPSSSRSFTRKRLGCRQRCRSSQGAGADVGSFQGAQTD